MTGGDPWAIWPATLGVVRDLLQQAAGRPGRPMTPSREASPSRAKQVQPAPGIAQVRDGVAVVPVFGVILRRAPFLTPSVSTTSLAAFSVDLTRVDDNPAVRAIMIEVDSPGGELTGLHEAASLIRSISARKPVIAYTEGQVLSGAYQLAAAAREVVVAPTAVLGSLGVVMSGLDRSEADARAGLVRFEFVSRQTPGRRRHPASAEGRSAAQVLVDGLAREFLADIAHSRGTTAEALIAATGGGGLIVGRDAVTRGLADRIAGRTETVARLAAGDVPAPRRRGQTPPPGSIAALAQPAAPSAASPLSPQPPSSARQALAVPAVTAGRAPSHHTMPGTLRQRAMALLLEETIMTEEVARAIVDRRVLAVALQDVAASRGGMISGTAAELFPALLHGTSGIAADPAAPTCAAHLDHLLRELTGSSRLPAGIEVTALRKRAFSTEWQITAVRAA